jgi:hypothetical protein
LILGALAIDPERRYRHYSEVAFDFAHPEKVEPFFLQGVADRIDSLRFYRTGFFLLLAVTLYLLAKLLHH